MIDRKFLRFRDKQIFEREKRKNNISSSSIVFIKGPTERDKAIYNDGVYYTGYSSEKSKGFYETYFDLVNAWPNPEVGDWAIIGHVWVLGERFPATLSDGNWIICSCDRAGHWKQTPYIYEHDDVDLTQYLKKGDINPNDFIKSEDASSFAKNVDLLNHIGSTNEALALKLDILISGTNIKTINEQSILTEGNIDVVTPDELDDRLINYVRMEDIGLEPVNPDDPHNYATKEDLLDYTKTEDLDDFMQEQGYIKSGSIPESPIDLESILDDIESLKQQINNIEIPLECNCPNHVFLTQEQYDALENKDNNTIYFILEHEIVEGVWVFGDKLPAVFCDQWVFGNMFPIILT